MRALPGLSHAWQTVKRPCSPDCTARGNCNQEYGACECPFGYSGAWALGSISHHLITSLSLYSNN